MFLTLEKDRVCHMTRALTCVTVGMTIIPGITRSGEQSHFAARRYAFESTVRRKAGCKANV